MAVNWTMEEVERLYALFRPTVSTTRGKTLLLADSDDSTRNVSGAQLQQKGFTIWCAANSLDALTLLRERRPDCCVLDLNLQPLSGLDLLEAISRDESFKDTIIYLSALSPQRDNRLVAQIYGAEEILRKPLQAGVVADKIAERFSNKEKQSNPD